VIPPGVRSILLALDESSRAPAVFETGTALARQLGAEVCIIRVLWIPPEIPPAAHVHPNGVQDAVERAAHDELHALMRTAPDVTFRPPIVVEGEPWRQIIHFGDQLDVDLIVMGNHRYHGVERVLGTVAAKVVNHARRDVLVVHARRAPQASV
jgi:nucleotide-binding universal stress UspA family protein